MPGGRDGDGGSRARVPSAASWGHYQHIADTASEVVYEAGPDGLITWVSPTAPAVLGLPPEALLGTRAVDLVHPEDAAEVRRRREEVLIPGGPPVEIRCRIRTPRGYRSVQTLSRAQTNGDGAVTGVVVSVRDVHEAATALRALTTLSQANRTLVHSVDEAKLLVRMCEAIVTAGQYRLAWYGRPLDDPAQSVAVVVAAGPARDYVDTLAISWGDNPLGRGPTGRAVRTERTQVLDNMATDPDYAPWRDVATRSGFACSISLPVLVRGTLDGVLTVYADEPESFDTLARELMEDLSADLGFGLARLRDVDDLLRTRAVLAADRERLAMTLDSQFDPFALMTAVRGPERTIVDFTFTLANRAAAEDLRVPASDLVGSLMLARFPALATGTLFPRLAAAVESGEPLVADDFEAPVPDSPEMGFFDVRGMPHGEEVALSWRNVSERHAAARRLAEGERRYRLLAENSSDVVMLIDLNDLRILWVSTSFTTVLGWSGQQWLGRPAMDLIHPPDRDVLREGLAHAAGVERRVRVRYRVSFADGTLHWVQGQGRLATDEHGAEIGRVVSLQVIDDQVRAEQELQARERQYHLLAENASDVVWQVDHRGRLAWTSESVTRLLGWSAEAILGGVAMDLIHPQDRARAIKDWEVVLGGAGAEGEFRVLTATGASRWMALRVRPVPMPEGMWRVVSLRDIDDEVAARADLAHAIGHDPLTGLPTQRVALERSAALLARHDRPGRAVGMLCVGVDWLSRVNDALTHAAGDRVLTVLATRIAAVAGPGDLVARSPGAEFLVVLPDLADPADAGSIAERIRSAARDPLMVGDQRVDPTVSIGIATAGAHADPGRLLRDASIAMRLAKANGRDRCEFVDAHQAQAAQRRLALEVDIRNGLVAGEFRPWYQPIVSLGDRRLLGFEALVRWERPGGRVVGPGDFLPTAQRTHLVTEIDLAVLPQAVCHLQGLPEHQHMAVNVSPGTLTRTDFPDLVLDCLGQCSVEPARLHLEVTETALLDVTSTVRAAMAALAGVGVRWYVDDFGTGYSSISHLRDLPVSGMKLDLTFTRGLGAGDRTCEKLAQALAGLAAGLELDTVAEGVETEREAEILAAQGWARGQGWLFGRPAP